MRYVALIAAFALAACGSCGTTGDDDDGDGGSDGINPRGTVTLHLVDKVGAPIPDMRVMFTDTDQALTEVMTDAAGVAQAEVNEGATVTAMRVSGTGCSFALTTVTALLPGDEITLISAPSSVSNSEDPFSQRVIPIDMTSAGNFTINYAAASGAQAYRVYTPCGPTDVGASTSPTLPFMQGCVTSPMTVVVVATTNTGTPLKYTEQANVTFTAGGNTTVTDTWHDVTAVTGNYSNTTSYVTRIELERFGPYVRGLPMTATNGAPAGNMAMLSATGAVPSTAMIRTRLMCAPGSGPDCVSSMFGVAQQTILQATTGSSASYSLDVGANALPWISGDYNPETRTMEVQTTRSEVVDLFEGNLRYYRMGAPAACTMQWIYTWRVFAPIAQSVTFPTLPDTTPGDPNVRPTDTQSAYQLYLCDSDAITGYREAVKNPYESLAVCEGNPQLMSRPVTAGMVSRLSQWN